METILVVILIVFVLFLYIWHTFNSSSTQLRTPPRVRDEGKSRFSLKTRWAYMTNCRELYSEAYEKYTKHGRTCLLPSMGFKEEVHIPPSSVQWAASQPDNVLSGIEGFREIDKGDWNSGNAKYIQDPWQALVVMRDLNKVLHTVTEALEDELQVALEEYFGGNQKEWREVELYDAMRWIVAQASSRFTVGLPLCRDKSYLKASLAFADLFILNTGLLAFTPSLLKAFLGPIFTLPSRFRKWQIKKAIEKAYHERLSHLLSPTQQQDLKYIAPQDTLQMLLQHALTHHPSDLNLSNVTSRLCLANLASFHQTAIAATNILLNILSSNSEYETLSLLRQEITSVLQAHQGKWSKAAAAKMVRTDSVLRESMRKNAFGNRAMIRKVVSEEGLGTEDGYLLPCGTTLSVLAYPVHFDGEIYKNPGRFDPWRFLRVGEGDGEEAEREKFSFVSTGRNYLPFGHGKHACPGRRLVDVELKMIVGFVLMNYEIKLAPEHKGVRPEGKWIAEAVMPPSNAKVVVKRRTSEFRTLKISIGK